MLLAKEDAFLRRHPAREIVISLTVLAFQNSREGCGSLVSGLHSVTPFSCNIVPRMRDVLVAILEDTEVLAQTGTHSGGCTFVLYSIWFLSFSPSSNQVTAFHRPLYFIALPYRQVGHFVQHLRKFKGRETLADQGEIEGKSEESDWFR